MQMARYRPRGNKSQRVIGKVVGRGIRAAHCQCNVVGCNGDQENERTKKTDGETLFSKVSGLIFLLINGRLANEYKLDEKNINHEKRFNL